MKKKKEDPTHELIGEQYLCDDVWDCVGITKGTRKHCKEIKESCEYEYRNMAIIKL